MMADCGNDLIGGRQVVDDGVDQRLHAHVAPGRAAEDGNQGAADGRPCGGFCV